MFVDILIIAVITLSIMICYHKGVILSLFNMMSAVLSFVLIAVLYEPVVDAFKKSYIGLKLEEIIRSRVAEWFLDAEDNLLKIFCTAVRILQQKLYPFFLIKF